MTGHKRMELEESVKEHKSDDLSSLFNMLVFKKQRDRGKKFKFATNTRHRFTVTNVLFRRAL